MGALEKYALGRQIKILEGVGNFCPLCFSPQNLKWNSPNKPCSQALYSGYREKIDSENGVNPCGSSPA